jgi:acyl transferase domain-containing protein
MLVFNRWSTHDWWERTLGPSAHSQASLLIATDQAAIMPRTQTACSVCLTNLSALPAATGGSFSVAAGRLSFSFGFRGPAVSIDTACSSALVAIHYGYLGLQDAHTSLAAGVNMMLSVTTTAAAQSAGMLSQDGRCKTMDALADGYVRAEACTAILMEVSSLYNSHAVYLQATYTNQDGRSSSLTTPNGPSQQAVIRGALTAGGVHGRNVDMLEMHGTGKPLLLCDALCGTNTLRFLIAFTGLYFRHSARRSN